ncbi:MAG: pyruvate kinase [Gammaproteobacteria bacterium]|nr:pyruvate kinase [Gammaproteobacteria bacterium]
MLRRTKILATLGPATDAPETLEELIHAGLDVVRLNFSHGASDDHARRVAAVRAAAAKVGKDVGILADLQGPKIRIEKFVNNSVRLNDGENFVLDAELGSSAGTEKSVGISYKNLPNDVKAGDTLLLNDGLIVLNVERVGGAKILCKVETGGELSNNKGINRLGGGLTAPALTEKDKQDIKIAAELGVDYVAISFPRDANDVQAARDLLWDAGCRAGVIAKIERAEAVDNIESIVEVSDAVMIARGDLAVEIGDAELPAVQKSIIHVARDLNTVVITATQMMESMINNPIPTRAEVSDVANAVMDGTDAVMLSAETASGKYPVKAVEAMARVCLGAEKQRMTQRSKHRLDSHFERVDEAIAMATMYTANHLGVKAIVSLTESGSTALWMSRIRSGIPIYALTRHETTRRRVTLYRGVYPVAFDVLHVDPNKVLEDAAQKLKDCKAVHEKDLVIVTKGDFDGVAGGTNAMKILKIGEKATRF